MSEPKPSEVLRQFFDKSGWLIAGSGPQAHDKLLSILNRLDAEQRRLAAKVDGPPVQPASEWPKWYTQGLCVVRVVSEKLDGDFWYPDGKLEVLNVGAWVVKDWPRIDHAKAIALIPAIANTHPLPAKPDPTTEAPADGLEAEAREWAEKLIVTGRGNTVHFHYDGQSPGDGQELNVPARCDQSAVIETARNYLRRNLTAFAARAIERHKARTAASEADFADRLKVAEDEAKNMREQRDELSATIENFHRLIDAAQDQPKGTTSMDSLDTRIENLVKEKDRCVYYQDIVYAVCNSLDRINRNIGLMGHIGADTGTVVCGTLDTPSDQVQRLMREVEQRIVNQKMSITHLDHKLAKAESDLDSARTECERLRGLIRDFTENMTKTLNGGAA